MCITYPMNSKDHPRSCGKDILQGSVSANWVGSPPLVRERQERKDLDLQQMGITPARAGKTDFAKILMTIGQDHPRSCGKDLSASNSLGNSTGSPPLVRERQARRNLPTSPAGITPARAGKTVMDSFICAISLLPVFKIYLISLQNICPPKNIKHVSPKYSYHNPLFKEASHYVYSIIKSVL